MLDSILNFDALQKIGAVLVAIIVPLGSGYLLGRHRAKLQQKTLAIKAMHRFWQDRSFQDELATVRAIVRKGNIAQYATKREDADVSDDWECNRKVIIKVIDYFEVISTGVNAEIYDVDIIARVFRTEIIRFFDETSSFIKEIREQNPKSKNAGKEFEMLAETLRNHRKL